MGTGMGTWKGTTEGPGLHSLADVAACLARADVASQAYFLPTSAFVKHCVGSRHFTRRFPLGFL